MGKDKTGKFHPGKEVNASKLIFYKDEVLKNKFKNICRIKGLGL